MMRALKAIARCILGEYDLYRIFAAEPSAATPPSLPSRMELSTIQADAIEASTDEMIRTEAWYAGAGAEAFACTVDGRIVGLCFFWHGARYRARNYWPLAPDEAKLVQIITVTDFRGKGVARALIGYSSARMFELGYKRLIARVWHSNAPSIHAFQSAGWRQIAQVLRFNPLRRAHSFRFVVGQRPGGSP